MGPYDFELPIDIGEFKKKCTHPGINTAHMPDGTYRGQCMQCSATWIGDSLDEVMGLGYVKPSLKLIIPEPPSKPTCSKCQGTGFVQDSYFGPTTIPCSKCDLGKQKVQPKEPKYKLDNAKDVLATKNKPGLEIVPATAKQLQLDYDSDEVPEQFNKVLPMLRQRFTKGTITWNKYHSSSGKHWHVILDLPEAITDQERIVWQAVFGSDYMREGLSLMRLIANIENPTLLFMMPDRVAIETGILPEPVGRKFKELI